MKKRKITTKTTIKTLTIIFVLIFGFILFPKSASAGLNTDYVELKVTYTKANGETCEAGSDCTSGNCVDGYCCDTACDTICEACDLSGTEGTCTDVTSGNDPDNECDTSCSGSCSVKTGDCDGAGSCETTPCSQGETCSEGSCSDSISICNDTPEYSSCEGDGCYNDGGNAYNCQAQCDGAGSCDWATNCSSVSSMSNSLNFDGDLSLENLNISFRNTETGDLCSDGLDNDGNGAIDECDPSCPLADESTCSCSDGIDNDGDGWTDGEDSDCFEGCTCDGTGYETHTVEGDTVYIDCNADNCWAPSTYPTKYAWSANSSNASSCVGQGSDFEACHHCDTSTHAGFDDWYLPSKTTLENLCNSGSCSGSCFGGDGFNLFYWSSTESGSNARIVWFDGCSVFSYNKTYESYVRCVR